MAMSSPASRKRPAPGALPMPAGPIQQPPQQFAPQDHMMRWNGAGTNGNNYTDVSNQYMFPQPAQHGQAFQSPSPSPSNVVALRENSSRALVPTTPLTGYDGQTDQWSAAANDCALIPASNGGVNDEENLEIALERARKMEEEAKRDNPGPSQKKSIPPFVMKLASFLNNGKNSDLIRWSEKGDSFIVLDEDEFAKKLIPEMFKHNNYASFVRQLNMYGFHKRVGLSDNSMRASEKKNKSPSEYAHKYFLRQYPILQWLIQKPSKTGGKKRQAKNQEPEVIEQDSDVEELIDDATGPFAVSGYPGKALGPGEAGPLAKTEMRKFQDQLAQVQQKQQQVFTMIQQLRQSQNEIIQRAQAFEQQHSRHENSITAILNFLANVFRKSLEEGGGTNLTEMLASILPREGQNPQSIPTGSVHDLSDLFQRQDSPRSSMSPVPSRRPQHLLPGIPGQQPNHARAVTPSADLASMPSSPVPYPAGPALQAPQTSRVTEVFDTSPSDTTSPNYIRNELESNPQETMMRIMGDTNARMTPGVDLPEVAASTPATMPTDQRNRMVSSMSRRTATPSKNLPTSAFQPPTIPSTTPMPTTSSTLPAPTSPQPIRSLSPILSAPRPPSMQEVSQPQVGLNELERMQGEVTKDIGQLAQYVAPLSPNGHIPGLDANGHPDSYFDFSQYLEPCALDPNYNFDLNDFNGTGNLGATTDGNDFDFSLSNPEFPQGTVDGNVSIPDGLPVVTTAEDATSPAIKGEIQRSDSDAAEPSAKRRRQA